MTFSIKPKPKMFPEHFNLLLDVEERNALDDLYELDPYLDGPNELLHQALRAGIRALNELTRKHPKDPHEPTRADVEATKRSKAQHKENSSPSKERTIFPKPHYHIEDYVAVPLETRLRIRLEDFLAENQGVLSDEESLQMLLDLGLEHAADQKPDHVLDMIKKEYRRRRLHRLARRA
jgi:hypothetical protein